MDGNLSIQIAGTFQLGPERDFEIREIADEEINEAIRRQARFHGDPSECMKDSTIDVGD